MADILTFTPRPRPAEPAAPEPLADADLRQKIEAGAQVALDLADHLIGLLDRVDGVADQEDGAEAEPSLALPENHGSQFIWTGWFDQDREVEVAVVALPWGGRGNVVAACSVAILALVAGGC